MKDLETRVQELEDLREIMSLEADYAHAADTVQPDLYGDVFREDGVLELGSVGDEERRQVIGREAIKQFCREVIGGSYKYALHSLHNPQIEVDGDTARGRLYFEATTRTLDDEIRWSGGSYQDEFLRTSDGWKIKKKVITFSFRR